MAKPTRVYWDACVWIAIVNEERAVPQGDNKPVENRFSMCKSFIERATDGEFEIIVSAFILAEICKSPKAKSENQSKLPTFLDHNFILMVPVDKDIGLKAQNLQLSGLYGLKPADAIHIASAQRANVTEIHSFDADFLRLDGRITANNGKPIKICKPGEGIPLGGLFKDDAS